MKRPAPSSEAGFVLLEAIVAVAIVAVGIGAALAAVASVTHATAAAAPRATLELAARNIVTDLRAATAYDATVVAGRSTAFDVAELQADGAARPLHVTIAIGRPHAGAAAVATVTVRDDTGAAASVDASIAQQAPAPGSTVTTAPCTVARCTTGAAADP